MTYLNLSGQYQFTIGTICHETHTVAHHYVTQSVCLHGLPQSLVTYCGTKSLSHVFNKVCQLLKIRQTSTTPHHPQYVHQLN